MPGSYLVHCKNIDQSLAGENWLRLFLWLALGLVIYFAGGRKLSLLDAADGASA